MTPDDTTPDTPETTPPSHDDLAALLAGLTDPEPAHPDDDHGGHHEQPGTAVLPVTHSQASAAADTEVLAVDRKPDVGPVSDGPFAGPAGARAAADQSGERPDTGAAKTALTTIGAAPPVEPPTPRFSRKTLWIAGAVAAAAVIGIAGTAVAFVASNMPSNAPLAAGIGAVEIDIAQAAVTDADAGTVTLVLSGRPGYSIIARDPEHPVGGSPGEPDPLGRVWLTIDGRGELTFAVTPDQIARDATLTFAYEGTSELSRTETLSSLGLLDDLIGETPTPTPSPTPSPTATLIEVEETEPGNTPAPWSPPAQPAPSPEDEPDPDPDPEPSDPDPTPEPTPTVTGTPPPVTTPPPTTPPPNGDGDGDNGDNGDDGGDG